jgi:hypothetical protein
MAGTGAYAVPIDMPLIAKKPLKTKMSKEAKAHFDDLLAMDMDLFEDESTGEMYARVTDMRTGKTEIRKCEKTDED